MRVAADMVGAEADRIQQFDDAFLEFAAVLGQSVDDQRLADDRADRHARVKKA